MYSTLLMVRKYVSKVTMSKLVSTLVSHSTQGDPRYDRSSTMCPWTWGKVCGIRTRSWRLATPRKTLENDDFTDLQILGGRARSGGRYQLIHGMRTLGTLGCCFSDTEPSEVERPPSSIRPLPGATLRGCTRRTYDTGRTRDRTPGETPVMYRDALCAPPLGATASAPTPQSSSASLKW